MIVRAVVTQFERAASRISSQLIPAARFYVRDFSSSPRLSLSVRFSPPLSLSLFLVDLFPSE